MLRFSRSIEAPLEELTAYALELRKNNYEATGQLCDQQNMPNELKILFDAFTVMSFRVARQIKKAEAVSQKDALTGLHNRRFLQAMGTEFLKKTYSAGQQCACLMLDIDHFKSINDTFGHNVGDMVLQHTARIINASVRSADLLARYGGEEFVVLVACTDARQGEELAHRIRHARNIFQQLGKTLFERGGIILPAFQLLPPACNSIWKKVGATTSIQAISGELQVRSMQPVCRLKFGKCLINLALAIWLCCFWQILQQMFQWALERVTLGFQTAERYLRIDVRYRDVKQNAQRQYKGYSNRRQLPGKFDVS